MESGNIAQVLPLSVGWIIVVTLGVGFAFFMVGISYITNRWTNISVSSNEEFSNASRSIKPGLIATGIVSAWTWAATLLTSSTVAYNVGISGGYFYGAGGTCQVLFFAILATKTKLIAPFASTYLSIVRARWGTLAHLFFMFFALATNILVSSMLVVGGADNVNSLTGMPVVAALFITPISVTISVLTGGMRASLISDYLHTTVLLAMLFLFSFVVYATSDQTGSSTTTMDQAYHNRGVASRADSISTSFLLGGLSWTFIPLVIASSLGLAARALDLPLSPSQVSSGLAAPAAAAALLGKPGAVAILILLFLAVTSAASAQLVAVSCIFTYDIYGVYINPKASDRQVFWASHLSLGAWVILMGVFGLAFYKGGIDLSWLYTFLGIILGPAVFPLVTCICWKKTSRNAAMTSTLIGLLCGMTTWLISAWKISGEISIPSLGTYDSSLAGSAVSFFLPLFIIVPWSLLLPDYFDWKITRRINSPHNIKNSQDLNESSVHTLEDVEKAQVDEEEGEEDIKERASKIDSHETKSPPSATYGLPPNEIEDLEKSLRSSIWSVSILFFVLVIFVPCMGIIPKIWTSTGLRAFIGIGTGFLFFSSFVCVILPVWESRESLRLIGIGMWKDFGGKKKEK